MSSPLFEALQSRNEEVDRAEESGVVLEDTGPGLGFSDDYEEIDSSSDSGDYGDGSEDYEGGSGDYESDEDYGDSEDHNDEDSKDYDEYDDEDEEAYQREVDESHLGEDEDGYDIWEGRGDSFLDEAKGTEPSEDEPHYDAVEESTPALGKDLVSPDIDVAPSEHRESEGGNSLTDYLNMGVEDFSLERGTVRIDSIVISKPKKESRKQSLKGLTGVVKEIGVLTPIHVMKTESFRDAEAEGREDTYTGPRYTVLDGFRRIYAALGSGIEELQAVIWDFPDPEKGADLALVLGLLLSKTQRRTWGEVWKMYQILEMQTAMSPASIEYLLELESGQAMKLKDIALATNYPEVWIDLVDKKKTLDQAYNALNKLRKEEDQFAIEDEQGLTGLGEAGELAGDATGEGIVSEEEIREILELNGDMTSDEMDGGEENEDAITFGEVQDTDMFGIGNEGELQSTSERKPLDPVLRNAILRRDNFSCQVCGLGDGIKSGIILGVAEVHHTVGVYNQLDGSRDDTGMIFEGSDIPKLLTVCKTCHVLIHSVVTYDGKLGISKEEFDTLPEHQQTKWLKVGKYAKALLWAEKKSGKKMKRAEAMRLDNKPFWEVRKENEDAIRLGDQVASSGRDYNDEEYSSSDDDDEYDD